MVRIFKASLKASLWQRIESLYSRIKLTGKKKISTEITHVILILLHFSLSRVPERFPLDIWHSDVTLQNCSQVDLLFWDEIMDGSWVILRLYSSYWSMEVSGQPGRTLWTHPRPEIHSLDSNLLFSLKPVIFMTKKIIQWENLFSNLEVVSATIKSWFHYNLALQLLQ